MLYQCISPAMCYVRLVAAAAERRHVKPGHVSTSETLQPGTPLTPHHTTLYTTLLTLNNPLNILIQHPPPHLTSVISKNPHQQQPCLHDNSKYKIFLPSPLSRNYHVAVVQIWNVGRMRSIVLLSLPDFAQFFFIFLSYYLLQHIFRHIDFRYDRYYQPPTYAENFWNFCRDLSKSWGGLH